MTIHAVKACIGCDENGNYYALINGEWVYCGSLEQAISEFCYWQDEQLKSPSPKMK